MPRAELSSESLRDALHLLQAHSGPDPDGYVHLQDVPMRAHHLLIASALERTEVGSTIFEGGVSSGYLARVLAAAGRVVDGFELDEVAADRARSVCRNVWTGDISELEAPMLEGPYDLVLFGDTLEHLPQPGSVLSELRGQLKPGGSLVVSVPNIANWSMRLQLLAGRFNYTERGIMDRTHLRFFTARSIAELIASAGFDVASVTAAVPVPLIRHYRLCEWAHRLGNLRPGFFAYNLIVVATNPG